MRSSGVDFAEVKRVCQDCTLAGRKAMYEAVVVKVKELIITKNLELVLVNYKNTWFKMPLLIIIVDYLILVLICSVNSVVEEFI